MVIRIPSPQLGARDGVPVHAAVDDEPVAAGGESYADAVGGGAENGEDAGSGGEGGCIDDDEVGAAGGGVPEGCGGGFAGGEPGGVGVARGEGAMFRNWGGECQLLIESRSGVLLQ